MNDPRNHQPDNRSTHWSDEETGLDRQYRAPMTSAGVPYPPETIIHQQLNRLVYHQREILHISRQIRQALQDMTEAATDDQA